ncbi:histidine kinase dimerization/phosphoacceptor domain -containing protein [Spirochaetota bacterium]
MGRQMKAVVAYLSRNRFEITIIFISVLFGLFIWIIDSFFDFLVFHPELPFIKLLFFSSGRHEIYHRLIVMVLFISFGFIFLYMNKKLRRYTEMLSASNQQLKATEQQLKASNQQLRASEQQLKASNQQLRASEQQLGSSNQELMSTQGKLKTALHEREVLIKDIHHRVKNNMNLMISLLSLEKSKIQKQKKDTPELLQAIDNCINRIYVLSLIYTHLYQTDQSVESVNCRDFFSKLIDLVRSSLPMQENIVFHMDIENVMLPVNQLISLGLMVNEILSNAYKHAFKDKKRGKISFSIKEKNSNILVAIKDDGVGISGDIEKIKKNTLGLVLIDLLVQQIGGDVKIKVKKGVFYDITFPV